MCVAGTDKTWNSCDSVCGFRCHRENLWTGGLSRGRNVPGTDSCIARKPGDHRISYHDAPIPSVDKPGGSQERNCLVAGQARTTTPSQYRVVQFSIRWL